MCNDYIVIKRHRDGEGEVFYMDIYCTANVFRDLDILITDDQLFRIAANNDRESWVARILDFMIKC